MLQYIHRNVDIQKGYKKTFAFEAPDAEQFLMIVKHKLRGSHFPVFIKVGIANVHIKDNYRKSTGRELATERLKSREFYIANISFGKDGKIDLVLIEQKDSMALKVGLQTGKPQARVLSIQLDSDAY